VHVHTSTLGRASDTVQPFLEDNAQQTSKVVRWSALNRLDTGICHGLSPTQIQEEMPEEWAQFMSDPFRFRVPNGESYLDLVRRLESFVLHMER